MIELEEIFSILKTINKPLDECDFIEKCDVIRCVAGKG